MIVHLVPIVSPINYFFFADVHQSQCGIQPIGLTMLSLRPLKRSSGKLVLLKITNYSVDSEGSC